MAKEYEAISIDHASCSEIQESWFLKKIDVILLDLNLPNDLSIRIVRHVREMRESTKIVVLVPDDHEQLLECVAAGVHGCILERTSIKDLQLSISKAIEGETVCSGEFAAVMFSEISRSRNSISWQTPMSRTSNLTAREQEILQLLAKRSSNKQIAKALCVSLHTVKNHVHNILEKLDVENRSEAVERVRHESWLTRF
jgi:DNA-binding NarL/FixJ family response regulator